MDHPIDKLIIQYYYQKNLPVGREQNLSSIRPKYWIPACRGNVRPGIISCLYYKR